MEQLARELARGLDARTTVRITAVTREEDGWRAEDEDERTYHARALVLTAPAPQSLALLDTGGTSLADEDRAALGKIAYEPCLTGIFEVNSDVGLPAPGAIQRPQANVSWVADNHRKGISPDAVVLTVQASPTYSRQLWELSDERILSALRVDLMPFIRDSSNIREAQLKRWRYSLPSVLHPDRCLLAAGLPPLAFAGDAFKEPRVEGAVLSGLAAGAAVADKLAAG